MSSVQLIGMCLYRNKNKRKRKKRKKRKISGFYVFPFPHFFFNFNLDLKSLFKHVWDGYLTTPDTFFPVIRLTWLKSLCIITDSCCHQEKFGGGRCFPYPLSGTADPPVLQTLLIFRVSTWQVLTRPESLYTMLAPMMSMLGTVCIHDSVCVSKCPTALLVSTFLQPPTSFVCGAGSVSASLSSWCKQLWPRIELAPLLPRSSWNVFLLPIRHFGQTTHPSPSAPQPINLMTYVTG